jgi:hypothetical protein
MAALLFICLKTTFSADVQKLPYKAKSVDECIREQECLWFAFSSYMGFQRGVEHLTRWGGPIKYAIISEGWSRSQEESTRRINVGQAIMKAFRDVKPYFPYAIDVNIQPNLLIVETRDIKNITPKSRDAIILVFSQRTYHNFLQSMQSSVTHFELIVRELEQRANIVGGLLVIEDKAGAKSEKEVPVQIFNLLGFEADPAKPSLNGAYVPNLRGHTGSSLNDLHFSLIETLYHPEFYPGEKASDVKQAFAIVYPEIRNRYLERKAKSKGRK